LASDCLFCKIFTGEIQTRKIYQDENIHKKHVREFYELEDGEMAELFKTVKMVAHKLEKVFNPKFVCMFSRGQLVPHAHIIVFPSSPLGVIDGVLNSLFTFHQLIKESTDSNLDELAERIRQA
jgi:diadenosine tetraphosphate (Ap4A) HIT family hydrolase